MIIADTNIISYLLLPTKYTDSVENLYRIESDWAAPTLWRSEFRNVLALYLRKDIITFEKALQLQDAELPPHRFQAQVDCHSTAYLAAQPPF